MHMLAVELLGDVCGNSVHSMP